jgi:hypothetical protein
MQPHLQPLNGFQVRWPVKVIVKTNTEKRNVRGSFVYFSNSFPFQVYRMQQYVKEKLTKFALSGPIRDVIFSIFPLGASIEKDPFVVRGLKM